MVLTAFFKLVSESKWDWITVQVLSLQMLTHMDDPKRNGKLMQILPNSHWDWHYPLDSDKLLKNLYQRLFYRPQKQKKTSDTITWKIFCNYITGNDSLDHQTSSAAYLNSISLAHKHRKWFMKSKPSAAIGEISGLLFKWNVMGKDPSKQISYPSLNVPTLWGP